MAYDIQPSQVAAHGITLTANTVETVTFEYWPHVVEVVSDGAAEVYYTIDGSAPTVGGANCFRLPATPCVDSRSLEHTVGTVTIKLISAGTPKVSVQKGV